MNRAIYTSITNRSNATRPYLGRKVNILQSKGMYRLSTHSCHFYNFLYHIFSLFRYTFESIFSHLNRTAIQPVLTYIRRSLLPFLRRHRIRLSVILVLLIWFVFSLPKTLFNAPTSYVITDRNGNLLNASIAADGQWRFPYDDNVPDKFSRCLVAFEDKRFWYHPGVDPVALSRAIYQDIKNKETVSGGSTLTMQVMRMSRNNTRRSVWNKISETLLALRLECSYSKKSILALYASNAPFGGNIVGLDAAAWRYYGRSPQLLSWGECAALAVLPNAPSVVHPGRNSNELLRKRNALLATLLKEKIIDTSAYELAQLEPLPGVPKPLPELAPHLLNRFRKDRGAGLKNDNTVSTYLQTTLDIHLQQQVSSILALHQALLAGNQIRNACAMVVETGSGNIVSYVGNIYRPQDSLLESSVDVLSAPRSPGSTLKPLLYASLLTEGTLLPKQLIPDIPTQIGGYTPQNFDLHFDGAVPANMALARSLNIPAVKMLQQYKSPRFYSQLKGCGFTTLTHPADWYGMSLILGGCEVTPYELAGVYSSFARMYLHQSINKGKWNEKDWFMPKYCMSAVDRQRSTAYNQFSSQPLFDYPAIWHTLNAMTEVMRPGEEGLWGYFSSAQRIAWKTGTSFGFRDGWAVGITPKYTVVVWVGNTTGEGRPELTGIKTAAPILFDIFRVLPSSSWFKPPQSGFIYLPVCHQSGYKAGSDCSDVDTVLVSEAATNIGICPYHQIIHLDKTGQFRVTEKCEAPSQMQHRSWFVLPPAIEYYYRQRHADYKPLPPFLPGCSDENAKTIEIIYPDENAKIYVPLERDGQRGRTIFSAADANHDAKLLWYIDDEYMGNTAQFHQMAVTPPPGLHTLTVTDENGESAMRHFTILDKEK